MLTLVLFRPYRMLVFSPCCITGLRLSLCCVVWTLSLHHARTPDPYITIQSNRTLFSKEERDQITRLLYYMHPQLKQWEQVPADGSSAVDTSSFRPLPPRPFTSTPTAGPSDTDK